MKLLSLISAITIFAFVLISTGCEGTGNPFAGSVWKAGTHTVSFSHGVADWSTADNKLVLKFDLITGASLPTGEIEVADVSTLLVNQTRDVKVKLNVSSSLSFQTIASDPDASASVTFTRLDLGPLGAVSGHVVGNLRSVENPSETVAFTASFGDVPIVN